MAAWEEDAEGRDETATVRTRVHTHAYARMHDAYVDPRPPCFLRPQSGRETWFLNVTMVADKEINQSSLH